MRSLKREMLYRELEECCARIEALSLGLGFGGSVLREETGKMRKILSEGEERKRDESGYRIDGAELVYREDGGSCTTVYLGDIGGLRNATKKLKWRKEKAGKESREYLTLAEIAEQLSGESGEVITIFTEGMLTGQILQYGVYGDYFVTHGRTDGLA